MKQKFLLVISNFLLWLRRLTHRGSILFGLFAYSCFARLFGLVVCSLSFVRFVRRSRTSFAPRTRAKPGRTTRFVVSSTVWFVVRRWGSASPNKPPEPVLPHEQALVRGAKWFGFACSAGLRPGSGCEARPNKRQTEQTTGPNNENTIEQVDSTPFYPKPTREMANKKLRTWRSELISNKPIKQGEVAVDQKVLLYCDIFIF